MFCCSCSELDELQRDDESNLTVISDLKKKILQECAIAMSMIQHLCYKLVEVRNICAGISWIDPNPLNQNII